MTDEQIGRLRSLLERQMRDHEELLRSTQEGARPVDLDEPIGRLTRMDALQQQSMTSASRRTHKERLALIRQALAAIEAGEYGTCRSCDEEIGFDRLEARPETPFCLDCQAGRDRGQGR